MTDWTKTNSEDDQWDFDWRETPPEDHPKKCNCPKHEYFKEQLQTAKQTKEFPITLKLCPDHYRAYQETREESNKEVEKKLPFFQKMAFKFFTHPNIMPHLIDFKELRYNNSDLCYWCKFGSGGRGKKTPIAPDQF